ncbi:hypothetical protein N9Y91_00280 [Alphaproteobacteria bacterium]|nr:hypothetical protein [Alphaproteobacteria bacterium]
MPQLLTRVAILAAALNASPLVAGGLPEPSASDAAMNTQESSTTAASTGASTNNEGARDGTGFIAIEDDPLIVDTSAIMDSGGMGKGFERRQQLDEFNWRCSAVIYPARAPC